MLHIQVRLLLGFPRKRYLYSFNQIVPSGHLILCCRDLDHALNGGLVFIEGWGNMFEKYLFDLLSMFVPCSPLTFGSFTPFESYCGTPIFLPYEKLGKFVRGISLLPCFFVSCHSVYGDSSFWCIHMETYKWSLFCYLLQIGEISVWKTHLICSSLSI